MDTFSLSFFRVWQHGRLLKKHSLSFCVLLFDTKSRTMTVGKAIKLRSVLAEQVKRNCIYMYNIWKSTRHPSYSSTKQPITQNPSPTWKPSHPAQLEKLVVQLSSWRSRLQFSKLRVYANLLKEDFKEIKLNSKSKCINTSKL